MSYSKMKKYMSVILLTGVLTGCASKPYATLTLAHQVDNNTDYWVQTTRSWQCHNPQAQIEAGLEWRNSWQLGYWHQSWIGCGQPFGADKPEVYQDAIVLRKKFGGYK